MTNEDPRDAEISKLREEVRQKDHMIAQLQAQIQGMVKLKKAEGERDPWRWDNTWKAAYSVPSDPFMKHETPGDREF